MADLLRREITLACPPAHAFQTFTDHVDLWWPRAHRKSSGGLLRFTAEALVDIAADGTAWTMATVRAFEPPRRLELDWFPGSPLAPTRVAPRIRGDADAVAAAADLLAKAERPVIIAGDAVAQSNGLAELAELAELIAAPVYVEFVPNSASFPASHPLYRGAMTRSQAGVREVIDRHDLLFSVGGDLFTWSLPSKTEAMPPGLPLIHLDTDPWQIGKNHPAAVGIFGDPKATLPDITAAVRARMSAGAKAAANARLTAMTGAAKSERDALVAKHGHAVHRELGRGDGLTGIRADGRLQVEPLAGDEAGGVGGARVAEAEEAARRRQPRNRRRRKCTCRAPRQRRAARGRAKRLKHRLLVHLSRPRKVAEV